MHTQVSHRPPLLNLPTRIEIVKIPVFTRESAERVVDAY